MAAWLISEANGKTLLAAQLCIVRCIVDSIELLSWLCDTAVDNTASLPALDAISTPYLCFAPLRRQAKTGLTATLVSCTLVVPDLLHAWRV